MAFTKKEEQSAPSAVAVKTEAPQTDVEKFKSLFNLSKQLDKKHSTTNSLMRLGNKNIRAIPSIVTGIATFDYDVLRTGGVPRGRILELFGPESSGKTTLSLVIAAEEQKQGGIVAFVDAEHALDPGYARQLGVDVDNLLINQPDNGEQGLQVVDELVESQCVSLIVVDSVAALVPEAELAGEIGDVHVGLQARMMSQAMRILTGKAARNNVTVIFINQIREKIGVMYGSPETTPGGRALKLYSSVRLDVRRKEVIKAAGDVLIGHQIRVKAVKNKCGTPFGETTLDLYYPNTGHTPGFDKVNSIIEYAASRGLFEMKGSWYYLDDNRIANGMANLKEVLKTDAEIMARLKKSIAELVAKPAQETI